MTHNNASSEHREILQQIAHRVMLERGLEPDFPADAQAQADAIAGPAKPADGSVRDLRELLWCSIDNDDSRDLDQLTVAEPGAGGAVKVLIAIADVDALVRKGTPLDVHAQKNTTSVYTAAEIFPMLPEKLSTDLTSLNFDSDRMAVVIELAAGADGAIKGSELYPAFVRNKAKLAYNSVAAWLDGWGALPEEIGRVAGLEENLRIQDKLAQQLKAARHERGALDFETIEARAVFSGEKLAGVEAQRQNRAKDLVADFMIAANSATARFLEAKKFPSVRRVVREPKRWERIVDIAAEHDYKLPPKPDSKALDAFLMQQKAKDAVRFPDLSLSIIKLLGPGEYVVEKPGEEPEGHFGLSVRDYTHSTAPNRRYPDVITQRLVKAAFAGAGVPYSVNELETLARHCTEAEDAAKKVERQVQKSAAALLLKDRIGQRFEGIVTGASDKGTWVRVLDPPVEGRLVRGSKGADVGERVSVELEGVDVDRGFIDFAKA